MASLGGEQQISTNSLAVEPVHRGENREGSAERKVTKDREEKLKLARERQNAERQRKIEELKAQAEAAQRYREQKEEERRRRIEEIRHRDTEKRHQVEERKRAIMEAEKERREYILRKNQERESKLEVRKRERNSCVFAFGSSTPRLLEPSEYGTVSPSTFWGQRRSTSISNVAGATLSRRSSERELADSGAKKRATSVSGTERQDDHRRKTSSMYEVFNWGYTADEPPKRYSLSIVGSEINIDDPPQSTATRLPSDKSYSTHFPYSITTTTTSSSAHATDHFTSSHTFAEDHMDAAHIMFRSVARRKTDLMPTIPSPRDGHHHHHFGSRSSLSNTPKTPGRAYSMNRLDQLAQPVRRNGEHIRAILERERREQLELFDDSASVGSGRGRLIGGRKLRRVGGNSSPGSSSAMSCSMTHLTGVGSSSSTMRGKYSLGGGISSNFRPLSHSRSMDASKSMTHLTSHHSTAWSTASNTPTKLAGGGGTPRLQIAATKKYLQNYTNASTTTTSTTHTTSTTTTTSSTSTSSLYNNNYTSNTTTLSTTVSKRGLMAQKPQQQQQHQQQQQQQQLLKQHKQQQHYNHQQHQQQLQRQQQHLYQFDRFDPNSLLLMNSSSLLLTAGSGNATPGGSTSRPGSAMSTSTTMSTTGYVNRRAVPAVRKPRPASIAGTGVSLEEINKLKKEAKPPVKQTNTSSAQTTPKRTSNLMSTSLIVTPTSRLASANEKKTPIKRETTTPKPSTPRALSKTSSSDRLNKLSKESSHKPKDTALALMSKSVIVTSTTAITANNGTAAVVIADETVNENSKEISIMQSIDALETTTITTAPVENVTEQMATELKPAATQPEQILLDIQGNIELDKTSANRVTSNTQNGKSSSEVRELTPAAAELNGSVVGNDLMTASMIARNNKITTEEQAKAALAERRRLAREEAERQAELERQRVEAERLAEIQRQEEEAERQRQFEEESDRLAQEARRAEEERLRQAIEEAKQREAEEQRKREEEERARVEREEQERKAKEETEKQRLEVAERLKREEKEREERRKRVEAIMLRTRKTTQTPTKQNDSTKAANEAQTQEQQQHQQLQQASSESSSTSGSTTTTIATTPTQPLNTAKTIDDITTLSSSNNLTTTTLNTQATYEQSVTDKETALINNFSNMIIDDNAKNMQQQHFIQQQQQQQTNSKLLLLNDSNNTNSNSNSNTTVANGNGHIENLNNKNEINLIEDVMVNATNNQLIDIGSMDINNAVQYNNNNNNNNNNNLNNNSLLNATSATTTLVTADSHENKDISLL